MGIAGKRESYTVGGFGVEAFLVTGFFAGVFLVTGVWNCDWIVSYVELSSRLAVAIHESIVASGIPENDAAFVLADSRVAS